MGEQTIDFYEFGRFRLKPDERLLLRGEEFVPLTPKAFDILLTLLENDGRIVRKDDLMKKVWPDTFVEEGNLTQNVSLLRKALGESATGPQFIETVPRRGYRFVAPVSRTNSGDGALNPVGSAADDRPGSWQTTWLGNSAAGSLTPGQESQSDLNGFPLTGSTLPPSRSPLEAAGWTFLSRRVPAVALTLTVVLASVGGIAYLSGRDKAGASTTAIQSIAVLPFVDDSPDADSEYLADEIAESLVK